VEAGYTPNPLNPNFLRVYGLIPLRSAIQFITVVGMCVTPGGHTKTTTTRSSPASVNEFTYPLAVISGSKSSTRRKKYVSDFFNFQNHPKLWGSRRTILSALAGESPSIFSHSVDRVGASNSISSILSFSGPRLLYATFLRRVLG
jgi:hypothetical protein